MSVAVTSAEIRPIVVLGAWSSGSTAVTGYLARLGAYSCPPHFPTNDPRTPVSYEPQALRDTLSGLIDEATLRPKQADLSAFRPWFADWLGEQKRQAVRDGHSHLVLKHPLMAFFVPDIQAVAEPSFVVVTRPLEAIERTRQRRRWPESFGRAGAQAIYQHCLDGLATAGAHALMVHFDRFRAEPSLNGRLPAWVGMAPSAAAAADAAQWIG